MKLSLNWLNEFVEVPPEPRELKANLTMVGLGVESFARVNDDWMFEVEVTTNRPDCLSHYGVAREVSTLYRKPLRRLEFAVREAERPTTEAVTIEIADSQLCARYCGRVIENVQVKPSPEWLARRLEVVGMRPINNVTDVTNYVLMELGHPLHAFDLARLRLRKILVRRARAGEELRTLDGMDRALTSENLVIADGERPVALAGVMGGEESQISSRTRSVLLESAWFEPLSIRRTSKSHGMHTEASHRFERGADIEMAPVALDRAAALIAELTGGEVLKNIIDVYPEPKPRQGVTLRRAEILRLLGIEVSCEDVERILCWLGFRADRQGTHGYQVTPPSYRLDVTREVDLIEELARHYGYDRLPARLRPAPPSVERDKRREKELAISAALVGLGYREIITSPMIDPAENVGLTDRPPVLLANPLSHEASAMRSTPIPSMLRALRWNLDRDQGDLRFFETGKTYTASANTAQGLPDERGVLTLGVTGHRRPGTVHDSEKPRDFFDLKGDLEALLESFDAPELHFEPASRHGYAPDRCGQFVTALPSDCGAGAEGCGGSPLVLFGQLNSEVAREYKLRQAVWLAEVDLDQLLDWPLKSPSFRTYSKFPAVQRDFSLVVPQGITYARIKQAICGLAMPEIRNLRPADLFRGGSVASGYYSLLLRVTFQSQRHTLTSPEIEEASKQLLRALEPLDIRLRS